MTVPEEDDKARDGLGPAVSDQSPQNQTTSGEGRSSCAAKIIGPQGRTKQCDLPSAPGSDLCIIHAGILRTNRPVDGRYSHLFRTQTLLDCYLRMRNDPEIADLTEEVALARTLLAGSVARLKAESLEAWQPGDKAEVMAMLDTVFKATETLAKVEKQMQTNISVSQLARITEQAATLFLRELEGVIDSIKDDINAKEIRSRLPEIMHRIGKDLESTELPFSPTRWVRKHGEETVPVSARKTE